MKLVPLTQGYFAMVDDEDYARVSQFKWYADKKGGTVYAGRRLQREPLRRPMQYMHRLLHNPLLGEEVDHKNGNGLDNRKENLRCCSHAQNMQGFQRKHKNAASRFRGVVFNKHAGRFQAQIKTAGKMNYLGLFDCPEEAARVRDAKARELGYPEFGMNFPQ